MITEKMLELLILNLILNNLDKYSNYKEFLTQNYNVHKLENRYLELGSEFLLPYALNKTEKSD